MAELDAEALKQRIIQFLREFKILVHANGLILKERAKNQEGLRDIGYTRSLFVDEILSLSLRHYSEGPTPDEQHQGEYWVFGKEIAGAEFYIKLKIVRYKGGRREAICLSFHRAAWPLRYPFRRQAKP